MQVGLVKKYSKEMTNIRHPYIKKYISTTLLHLRTRVRTARTNCHGSLPVSSICAAPPVLHCFWLVFVGLLWITTLAICRNTTWEWLHQMLTVVWLARNGSALVSGRLCCREAWSLGLKVGPAHHCQCKKRCGASFCTSGTTMRICNHTRCGPSTNN